MNNVTQIYNYFLPLLKGGEQKCFWVILIKTLGQGIHNTTISTADFKAYGSSVTKKRDIEKATQDMRDRGLISIVKDDELGLDGGWELRYSVKTTICPLWTGCELREKGRTI